MNFGVNFDVNFEKLFHEGKDKQKNARQNSDQNSRREDSPQKLTPKLVSNDFEDHLVFTVQSFLREKYAQQKTQIE